MPAQSTSAGKETICLREIIWFETDARKVKRKIAWRAQIFD